MNLRNHEISRSIRKALRIHPAAIGGAAVVVALAGSGIMPAGAADITISGSTAGAQTNSALLDFIQIDNSTVNGDITNLSPGAVTGLNTGPTNAVWIQDSTINGSFVNNATVGAPSLGTTAVSMMNTSLSGSITNTGNIRSMTYGVYLDTVTATGGFNNSGLIQSPSTAVQYVDTNIIGGITNSGTIKSQNEQGIYLSAETFSGGINNSGLIDSWASVINIEDVTTFMGGVVNTGTMIARDDEILDTGNTETFTGGINNSGLMRAQGSTAIDLDGLTSFSGGIVNSGTIISETDYGIYGSISTFSGGIDNSGLIDAESTGIYIYGDTFAGGIANSGTIISREEYGMDVDYDTFSGGINNSGLIDAQYTGITLDATNFDGGITNSGTIKSRDDYGIDLSVSTFTGGINNSGLIDAYSTAIDVSGTTFDGGIANSGTIIGRTEYGIDLNVSTFTGGINNSGLIDAYSTAITLSGDTFSGGIVNSGTIYNRSEYGIDLDYDTFMGGINNSGVIDSEYSALYVYATTFAGGITNSGTILSRYDGAIYLSATEFSGGIHNSGLIKSQETGIEANVSTFTGGIENSGTIQSYEDYGIEISGTTFDGGINNSGLIESQSTALYVHVSTFTGGITNSGTLLSNSEYGIDLSGETFAGGINNSGLIDAVSTGIYVGSTTFDGDIVNSGTIKSLEYEGIYLSGNRTITGRIENTGLIDVGSIGIDISGTVAGGIFNSGTIIGRESAIDVHNADGPSVINQDGGAIYGDIELHDTEADTVNFRGGMMEGILWGGSDMNDTLAFMPGAGGAWFTGNIDSMDSVSVAGGMAVFDGYVTNTNTLSVDTGGHLVLRPASQVNAGTYTQDASGTLGYEVLPGGTSGQIMAGTATLAGTLEIVPVDGVIYGDSEIYYSIVASPALTGTFDQVTSRSLFLAGTPVYGTTDLNGDPDVDLLVERVPFSQALAPSGGTLTGNQNAAAMGLEAGLGEAGTNAAADEIYMMLFQMQTGAEYTDFLDAISGSVFASAQQAAVFGTQGFNRIMQSRLGSSVGGIGGIGIARLDGMSGGAAGDPPYEMGRPGAVSAWVTAYGGSNDVDGDNNAPGFDEDSRGVAVGVDYQFSRQWLAGIAGSFGTGELDFDDGSNTDVDTNQFAIYTQWDSGTWFANGMFAYGSGDLDTDRRVVVGGVNATAKSDTDADTWSVYGEGGYTYDMGTVRLKPFLGVGWVKTETDGFTETGAGNFNLTVGDSDTTSVTSNLGIRASGHWMLKGDRKLTAEARAVWQHEFDDTTQKVDVALDAVRTVRFTTQSQDISRDTGIFGAGLNLEMTPQAKVFLNADVRSNSDYDGYSVSGGFRYSWW